MSIRTENLRKTYGGVKALDGLTLNIETGTVFGFLGPNGAGKTTTIRLLTGLAHPSAGRGWVAGEDIANPARVARRVGYLPEDPAFYTWMTPLEFLDYVGRVFNLPAGERKTRARTLLEMVGLSQAGKRRIKGFSRGMRQRLGLAQALMNDPEVLLLDEPASALDPAGRKEVLDAIRALRGQRTVFMSTHILSDAERVCDSIGIIDHGKMLVEAGKDELLARYSVPVFELECESGGEAALQDWIGTFQASPWVRDVQLDSRVARIVANEFETGRQFLLEGISRSGLPLRRFEVVTPSLEDIFLEITGKKETQA